MMGGLDKRSYPNIRLGRLRLPNKPGAPAPAQALGALALPCHHGRIRIGLRAKNKAVE